MSKFEGNFNVYIKLARKLAFRLPRAKDRLKSLRWIKTISDAKQVEENTRFHALHLLLICLQRKKLVCPFSKNPSEDKMLASYNWTCQPDDIARDILSKEHCENSQPPINCEVSNNFCDLLSYQEIPRFGVQFFYAFSAYEITKWHKLKKSTIPRSLLNKSITSNINKSSQYSFGNVTQEKVFPRKDRQAFNAGLKPETQEDVTFTANLKAKSLTSCRVENTLQLEDEVGFNNKIKANAQNESPRNIKKSYSKVGMNLSISKNDLSVQMSGRLRKRLMKKFVPKYEKCLRQNWTARETPEIFRKHPKRPFRKYELEEFLLPKDELFRHAKDVFEGMEYEPPEKRLCAIENEFSYLKNKTSGSNKRKRKGLEGILQPATISDDEVEKSWNRAYQDMMNRRQRQHNNNLEIPVSKVYTTKSNDESAPEDINSLNFSRIPTNTSLYLKTSRLETSPEKSRIKQFRKRLQELRSTVKRTSYNPSENERRPVMDDSENTHTSFQGEVEPSFVTIPYTKQMQKFGVQPSESGETGVSILSDREMEDLFEEGDVASPRVFTIQGLENLPKELLHDVSYPHMCTTGTSTYPYLGDESMPKYVSDSNLTVTSVKDYIPHSLGQSKYFKFVENIQNSSMFNDRISILHESEMDDLFDESLVAKYLPEWSSSRDHKQISVDKEKKEGIFENLEFIGDTSFPVGMNTTLGSFSTQSEKLINDESAPEDINSLHFSGIPSNPSFYLQTSRLETSLENSRIKQISKRLQELESKMKPTSYNLSENGRRTVKDAGENTHPSYQGEVEPSFDTIPYKKQMQKFEIQPSESGETGVSILSDREMEDLFEEGDVASPRVFKIQGLENLPKELLHDVSYPHMYTTGTSVFPNLGDESMPEYTSDSNLTVISVKGYIPYSVDNLQESSKYNDRISILHESEMDDLFDESLVAKYLPEWSSSRDHKQISVDKEKKEGIFENLEFIGDTSFPVGMNTTLESFPTQSEKLIYDESAPEDINSLHFSGIPTNPSFYLQTSRLKTSLENSRIKQIGKRLQELQSKMKPTSYNLSENERRTVKDAGENTHPSYQGEVEPSFVTIPYTKQMQKFEIQPSESGETGVSILTDREMEDLFEEGDVASPRVFKIQGLENLPKELLHDVSYPHMCTTGTSTYPYLGDESMPKYVSDSNLTVTSVKDYIPHSLGQSKYFKFVDNIQNSSMFNDRISILHESEMDDLFDESLVAKYLPEWSSSRYHKQISVDKEKKEGIFENLEFIGDTSFPVGMNTTLESFPTQSEKLIYDASAPEDINSLHFSGIPTNPSFYLQTSRLKTSLENSRIKQIGKRLQELQSKMKPTSYNLSENERRTVKDAGENTHPSYQGEVEPSFVTIPYTKQMQKFEIQPSESGETGVSILSDREMEDLFEEEDVASPPVFKIQGLENLPKELLHVVSYPHMYTTGTSAFPNLGDESMPEYISDSNLTGISVKGYIPYSVDNLQESSKYNDRISILHESEMDDLFDESLVAKYLPEWSSSRYHKQISVDKEKKEGIFENLEFIGDTSFPVGMNTTLGSFSTQSEKLIYDESAPEDINSLHFSGIPTNPSFYLQTSRLETSLENSRIKQISKRLQELESKMKPTSYNLSENGRRTVKDAGENTHPSYQGEVEPSFDTIPYKKQMQKFEIQPSESGETGVSILSDREMEDLFEEGDVASPRVFKIQGLENLPKELLHDVSYRHMYTTGTSIFPNLGDESMPEYISDSNLTVISVKGYIPYSVDNLQESSKYNDRISILHESEMDDLFDESLVAKYLPEWSSSRDHKQISVDKEKKEGIFENLEFIGDTSFPVGMNTTLGSFSTQSEKLIYDESAPEDINSLHFSGIPTNPSFYLQTSRLETSLENSRIKQISKRLQELESKMKPTSYNLSENGRRTVKDVGENTHPSYQGEVEPSFDTIPYKKQMQKFEIQPSESGETGVSILSDREMEDLFEEGDVASPRVFKIQGLENLPKELLHDVSYRHMYTTGTSIFPNLGDESMPEYISDSNLTVISVKGYIPYSVDNLQESSKYNDRISILHESEMDDLFDESLVAKYLPEWSSSRDHKQISVDKEKKEGIFENLEFIGDTSFPVGMATTVESFLTQSEKLIYDESAPEGMSSLNFSRTPTRHSSHVGTSKSEIFLEKSRTKQIRKRLQELQNKMMVEMLDEQLDMQSIPSFEITPLSVDIPEPSLLKTSKLGVNPNNMFVPPTKSVTINTQYIEIQDITSRAYSSGLTRRKRMQILPKSNANEDTLPFKESELHCNDELLDEQQFPVEISPDDDLVVLPRPAEQTEFAEKMTAETRCLLDCSPIGRTDVLPHEEGFKWLDNYMPFVDQIREHEKFRSRVSVARSSAKPRIPRMKSESKLSRSSETYHKMQLQKLRRPTIL